MKRYKLTIEYDGRPFVGWQRQDSQLSIQGLIEDAILKMTGAEASLFGAGRTDAGVHAISQVAHFDLREDFPSDQIIGGLNHFIKPHPISILSCTEVSQDFHARFSAKSRSYIYKITNRDAPLALDFGRAWHVREILDIELMQEGAKHLIGKHDFTSFRSAHCQSKNPIKTIEEITFTKNGDKIQMYIKAPSFLHNQVRIIMGNLRKVGAGKAVPNHIKKILEAKDRTTGFETAPPDGLYLKSIEY